MTHPSYSAQDRTFLFNKLPNTHYDLLVIGGGITGCGIALDAASRGIRTLLLEMQDFGAGTSSRSTKLVHGGLRYLKQFHVKMVAEVGRERAIVYENAPHVTTPERMMLPLYKGGTFGRTSSSFGLLLYDYLAGVKRSERREMLNQARTRELEPLLRSAGLQGSGCYVEYRTDDARLTLEVLKKAVNLGADALNYVKVDTFHYDKTGRISGVSAVDQFTGAHARIHASLIVNAAGPWVDAVRGIDAGQRSGAGAGGAGAKSSKDKGRGKRLRLTKGVHLVADQQRFPLRQAVYFDAPDGRMIFAIPREGKTYFGTTDTFYEGNYAQPEITASDRSYLLQAVNHQFPDIRLSDGDIESGWAGIRPLIYEEGKDPSEISRKDEIWEADSGLLTIAGGKLTGYRRMAETIVDRVVERLETHGGHKGGGRPFEACRTRKLPLSGGEVGGGAGFGAYVDLQGAVLAQAYELPVETTRKLVRFYGSNGELAIRAAGADAVEAAAKYGLPLDLYIQTRYAVREEMALTPSDFFVRRIGALYFDIGLVRRYATQVTQLMGSMLGWDERTAKRHTQTLAQEVKLASQVQS